MSAEFAPHDLTSNTSHSPFVVSASTEEYPAWKAFDGITSWAPGGWYWIGNNNGVDSLVLDLGPGNSKLLLSYTLAIEVGHSTRCPKDWTMQGSNDNSTWDTLSTVTNQIHWDWGGGADVRTFACDVQTTAYRYFRLNITANQGDTYTQVAELYLQGDDAAPAGVVRSFGAIIGS